LRELSNADLNWELDGGLTTAITVTGWSSENDFDVPRNHVVTGHAVRPVLSAVSSSGITSTAYQQARHETISNLGTRTGPLRLFVAVRLGAPRAKNQPLAHRVVRRCRCASVGAGVKTGVKSPICPNHHSHNLRVFGFWGYSTLLPRRVVIAQQMCKLGNLEVSSGGSTKRFWRLILSVH